MFEPCQIQNVLNNGVKNNVIKLTLDTGQELICTDNHKILARDGNYIEAKDTLGVSLMPFVHELRTMYGEGKYEYIYIPKHDLSNQGVYLHKLVAEAAHGSEKAATKKRCQNNELVVIHRANYNKINHRVVKIETVAQREVYDIQLGKIHNFALTNGLIVHNCGALYNASLFASDYAYSYGESLTSTFEVNMIDSSDMRKRQIIDGVQDEIAKLYSDSNYLGYKKDPDPKRQEELRRYQEIADGIIII